MTDARNTPPTDADAPLPWSLPMRPAELASRKPTHFDITPDAGTRRAIAAWSGIDALNRLRLKGTLTPKGRADWTLEAKFDAEVVQSCVVTLEPVKTRLQETVLRRYIADMPLPEADEIEIPEDDSAEPLPDVIDPAQVALEVLELALPLYPRADGAALGESLAAEPGTEPMTDEAAKPFANLRALMGGKSGDGPDKDA